MPGDIYARRIRICSKLVYNTKTRRNEDQMRSHPGNLQKKPRHYRHQQLAPTRCGCDQHWNIRDLSWQSRPLEKGAKRLLTIAFFSRIWLSLSAPDEFFSWPNLTGFSSLAPRHKDDAKIWMHVNGENELYVMKINSQGYPRGRLSWKLSSALRFQRSPTNFEFGSRRFSENCPGTLWTTSRLSRWMIHWHTTTSWCHLQDIVRTEITSSKKIT